jgi:hypothetical protein
MLEAMGMYVLISHNTTPTTISAMTILTKGMLLLSCNVKRQAAAASPAWRGSDGRVS